MNISTHTGIDLNLVKHLLEDGEIVAIPTETVYGLAANALNEAAVIKIFEAKNRPQFNPLIIHVSSADTAMQWVKDFPPQADLLAKAFWPGALTLLLDKNEKIPDLVTAGHSKVAIRVPAHPLTLELLNKLDFPLAAPSANPSGYVSPTTAQHVKDGLEGKIPYILDGGSCEVGLESTIIGWDESGRAVIYRAGGISKEAIAQVLEQEVISLSTAAENPATPGMLKSHYATTTPLHAGGIEELINQFPNKKAILIKYKEYYPGYPKDLQYILTPHNNIQEAARNLFKILRAADQQNADFILAEYAPQEGLGLAINDRIERAKWEWKK
jgi:L-threonylcarbamoyladenylate synthase